ncbi:Glucosyltransferase-like protein [Cryptotrichosporon argae]
MPRRSYAQHRAQRASTFAESDDIDSLASFSSYAASTHSYASSPYAPPRLRPRLPSSSASALSQSTAGNSGYSYGYSPLNPAHSLPPAGPAWPAPAHPAQLGQLGQGHPVQPAQLRPTDTRRRRRRDPHADERYDAPLRRWVRWMGRDAYAATLALGLVGVGVFKSAVGMGGFSGQGQLPMHGDFEAQRHWMEITLHRPMSEWYTYSPDWWQLDYPPLTAYVSYMCGYLGSLFDPAWFALDTSRRNEAAPLVHFMRMTVLVLEAVVWWSAVVVWLRAQARREGRTWRAQLVGVLTVLLQPGLALIDNGHFQYNSVLLGLSVYTLHFLQAGQDVRACVAFSLALGFKQMGLYYAPAVGCYLLGKCVNLGWPHGLAHFAKLAAATSLTFAALYAPWLRPFPTALAWVAHRIFPLARGIFEDKVANFWCASNVLVKWRRWVDVAGMARLATGATLLALLPTILILLRSSVPPTDGKPATPNTPSVPPSPAVSVPDTQGALTPASQTNARLSPAPTWDPATTATAAAAAAAPALFPSPSAPAPAASLLPLAMLSSSLAFFLFSFQVHEKSILLALMPLSLLGALRADGETWELGVLVQNVAVFSMWPLLKRDGQKGQYVVLTLLWNYVVGADPRKFRHLKQAAYLVYALIAALHALEAAVDPPTRYPDLFAVLNVLVAAAVFAATAAWANWRLLVESWAVMGRVR